MFSLGFRCRGGIELVVRLLWDISFAPYRGVFIGHSIIIFPIDFDFLVASDGA